MYLWRLPILSGVFLPQSACSYTSDIKNKTQYKMSRELTHVGYCFRCSWHRLLRCFNNQSATRYSTPKRRVSYDRPVGRVVARLTAWFRVTLAITLALALTVMCSVNNGCSLFRIHGLWTNRTLLILIQLTIKYVMQGCVYPAAQYTRCDQPEAVLVWRSLQSIKQVRAINVHKWQCHFADTTTVITGNRVRRSTSSSDSRRREVTEQMWYSAEDCSRSVYSGDWKSSVAVGWESGTVNRQFVRRSGTQTPSKGKTMDY